MMLRRVEPQYSYGAKKNEKLYVLSAIGANFDGPNTASLTWKMEKRSLEEDKRTCEK